MVNVRIHEHERRRKDGQTPQTPRHRRCLLAASRGAKVERVDSLQSVALQRRFYGLIYDYGCSLVCKSCPWRWRPCYCYASLNSNVVTVSRTVAWRVMVWLVCQPCSCLHANSRKVRAYQDITAPQLLCGYIYRGMLTCRLSIPARDRQAGQIRHFICQRQIKSSYKLK